MSISLETSLVWFCLLSIPVLAGLVDVTPRTLNRRYLADSAATSPTVKSISVPSIRSVSSTEQRADIQPASTLPSYVSGAIDLQKECILWDETCAGNRTAALEAFFNQNGDNYKEDGTMWQLITNNCFVEYFPYPDDASSIAAGLPLPTGAIDGQPGWSTEPDCSTLLPPESSSMGSSMLRWMRDPECLSNYDAYKSLHTPNFPPHTRNNTSWGDEICCGPCELKGLNVDIYYWPVPGVDTSCQSIIGTGLEPLHDGATTDTQGTVYWGYPLSSTNSDGQSVIYTAMISTMNGITFKVPLVNPWTQSGSVTFPLPPITSRPDPTSQRALRPRAHSLVIAQNGSNISTPITTMVSDGFTFTSPSIYVAFHSLTAEDGCGMRDRQGISSTLLAFSLGELSTINGPMMTKYFAETKSFDFANLPCPPQDVMEAQWYKPAPGEPYRPLLAVPDKVRSLKPEWEDCGGEWFYGYDPPKTLTPAAAMVPSPTPEGQTPQAERAKPSPTTDPGPKDTGIATLPKTVPKENEDPAIMGPPSQSLQLAADPSATPKTPKATSSSTPKLILSGADNADQRVKQQQPKENSKPADNTPDNADPHAGLPNATPLQGHRTSTNIALEPEGNDPVTVNISQQGTKAVSQQDFENNAPTNEAPVKPTADVHDLLEPFLPESSQQGQPKASSELKLSSESFSMELPNPENLATQSGIPTQPNSAPVPIPFLNPALVHSAGPSPSSESSGNAGAEKSVTGNDQMVNAQAPSWQGNSTIKSNPPQPSTPAGYHQDSGLNNLVVPNGSPQQSPGPGMPNQQSDSGPKGRLQPQNIELGSTDDVNPEPGNNHPRPATFAGIAQNQAINPSFGLHSSTIRPIGASPAILQHLPAPVVTIADQPVIASPTGQGYQIGSTAIKPNGSVAVFSGVSVYANSAGELVAGDKTYSPPPCVLAKPTVSTIDEPHDKASGSLPMEGAVLTAGASAPMADGVAAAILMGFNGGPKSGAIGDQSFALLSMQASQTASIGGKVVFAGASHIYNVDGAVVTPGGSAGRVGELAVTVLTSREGISAVGSQVTTLVSVNATGIRGGGVTTTPATSVNTPHGAVNTSSTAGPTTSDVQIGKGKRATGADLVWMLLSVVMIWGFTSLHV